MPRTMLAESPAAYSLGVAVWCTIPARMPLSNNGVPRRIASSAPHWAREMMLGAGPSPLAEVENGSAAAGAGFIDAATLLRTAPRGTAARYLRTPRRDTFSADPHAHRSDPAKT